MRHLTPTRATVIASGSTSNIYFNPANGDIWIPQPTRKIATFIYLQAPILTALLDNADHCGLWGDGELLYLHDNPDAKIVAMRVVKSGDGFKVHWYGDTNWGDSGLVMATTTTIPQVETEYVSLNTIVDYADIVHNSAGYCIVTPEDAEIDRADLVFTSNSGADTKATVNASFVKAKSIAMADDKAALKTVEFYNHMVIDHKTAKDTIIYTVKDATQDPTVKIATGAIYVWFVNSDKPIKIANLYDFTNPFIANWEDIEDGPNNRISPEILPATAFDEMVEDMHYHPSFSMEAMDAMSVDSEGNLSVNGVSLSNGISVADGFENWNW